MLIEELFGEVCGLNGDSKNMAYLRMALPEADFRKTPLTETPVFATQEPDMIYIGSMTEKTQLKVIEKLFPLKGRLQALIASGTVILATGNAGDIFSKSIHYEPENIRVDGLGLLSFDVKTDLFRRYHGKVLAKFHSMEIVGFQCRFNSWYSEKTDPPFLLVERGMGNNPESPMEGFRVNNFFCTSLLGPILPLNPLFTEYLIQQMGVKKNAACREEAMAAYTKRLNEFQDPKVRF